MEYRQLYYILGMFELKPVYEQSTWKFIAAADGTRENSGGSLIWIWAF
jgi:hypothetical protein